MNLVENLSSALQREQRRPVDLNLGQVPITPTIGRMGNYNVVTRTVVRDNAASELSRALSQLPQLIGQARNISEASGRQQAEDLTLDQIEERWKNGDTEAEGFMTWLGGNKAFEEAAYQRIFDASIKPSLTKVSGEIDKMSIAELSQLKSDEDISEFVQGRLVGGLDPEILQTIQNSPFQAIKHNRALEALIPEYTQRAAANINARKNAFQKKEAARAIESNLLTSLDGIIPSYNPPEGADMNPERLKRETAEFNTKAYTDYAKTIQSGIDFATQQGLGAGLDKFAVEDKIVATLSAKFNQLLGDEMTTEADLLLEEMEEGRLKINGRPINKTLKGLELMNRAEERLEADLKVEEAEADEAKLDGLRNTYVKGFNDRQIAIDYDRDKEAELIRNLQAGLDEQDLTTKEQLEMNDFYTRKLDALYGRGAVHAETTDERRSKLAGEIHDIYKTRAKDRNTIVTIDSLKEAANQAGVSDEDFESYVMETGVDAELQPMEPTLAPWMSIPVRDALEQAEKNTAGDVIDLPKEELFLGTYGEGEQRDAQEALREQLGESFKGYFMEDIGSTIKAYIEKAKSNQPQKTPEAEQEEKNNEATLRFKKAQYLESARDGKLIIDDDGSIKPRITRGGYSYLEGGIEESQQETYDLNAVNRTLENEFGVAAIKNNPLNKRRALTAGIAREAGQLGRVKPTGIQISKVFGTPQHETKQKSEIEIVRNSGIPMRILENGGIVEGTYKTGGFLGMGQKENAWLINYNQYGNLSNTEETTKRIYNMNAIERFLIKEDRSMLDRIQSRFLPSMDPQTFAENQATFYKSLYGSPTEDQPQQEQNNE